MYAVQDQVLSDAPTLWSSTSPLCASWGLGVWGFTRGALITHRYTIAPPCCRTSQHRRSFITLSVSLWNDLVDPVFDGVELSGFKSRSNAFLLAYSCSLLFCLQLFSLSLFLYRLVVGAGVFGLIVCQSPSPGLALPMCFNNNNNNVI